MTDQEARDLFSEAFDGTLTPEAREAFDAALRKNPLLREEYDEFCVLLQGASAFADVPEAPPLDFSSRVQERIHARSGGKYYRDRFSRAGRVEALLPVVAAALMLVLLAVCYWALGVVVTK